ncbi:MAG: flagellar biosynthesis protein FlhF [Candidatus Sumerlaeota bacterium]|nr:flagellar biosynthesis protein FlhF [Candidatus Sumerlaeota bacterium]
MLIRTFSGEDLPGVLAAVKKEFGIGALILSQRRPAEGALAHRGIELTAACLERGESLETLKGMGIAPLYAPKPAAKSKLPETAIPAPARPAIKPAKTPVDSESKKKPDARRFLFWGSSAYQKQQQEDMAPALEAAKRASALDFADQVELTSKRASLAERGTDPAAPAAPAAATNAMRSELADLRVRIEEMNQSLNDARPDGVALSLQNPEDSKETAETAPRRRASRLQRAIEELGTLGLEPEYARDVASEWFDIMDRDKPAPRAEVEAAIRKGIENLCAANADVSPIPHQGPRALAIVGPTGSGKTTTIAKIAARQLLESGRRVALLTCDTFRIAAIEQLRMYARIIGVPFRVVEKPEDLRVALSAYRDYDLILMDTPGLSPRLQEQFDKLHAILASHKGIEKLLVLSAATKTEEILEAWRSFSALGIHRLIISKSDEAIRFGCLLPAMKAAKIPVAFVTNGQRVPEDLIPATPAAVCQLFDDLWGGKVKGSGNVTQNLALQ